MKTIDEMCEIMQAYKNGKKIECYNSYDPEHEWCDVNEPLWNWYECDYRVKSESKYAPYDSAAEVERDKWLRLKIDQTVVFRVLRVDTQENCVYVDGHGWQTMKDLFEGFEYEDGSPCGKKIETKIYNEF